MEKVILTKKEYELIYETIYTHLENLTVFDFEGSEDEYQDNVEELKQIMLKIRGVL